MEMCKNNFVIGVLGGMGTFATINLFKQYAEVFHAEKEWDRPRIIIDNRCTMPSRVRAFLYNENLDELVHQMSESMGNLIDFGCNRIILACNTSHLFLPHIFKQKTELEGKVINIIDACVNNIVKTGLRQVFLLASEGTIDSGIYQSALKKEDIECIAPGREEYESLRVCIEAVKQNTYSEDVKNIFEDLMNRYDSCILGCTELPILYEKYRKQIKCKNIFDPLFISLMNLKKEYDTYE